MDLPSQRLRRLLWLSVLLDSLLCVLFGCYVLMRTGRYACRRGARSGLAGIFGRTSVYCDQDVTWSKASGIEP
jgi:hypothetical protein